MIDRSPTHFTEIARRHWGDDMPDWVARLAAECDATTQSDAARCLGRSASLVSAVLKRSYSGDMTAAEERVRGVLMDGRVSCPALGEMPIHECRDWRARTRAFMPTNSLRVRMHRACAICPRNRQDEEMADDH